MHAPSIGLVGGPSYATAASLHSKFGDVGVVYIALGHFKHMIDYFKGLSFRGKVGVAFWAALSIVFLVAWLLKS